MNRLIRVAATALASATLLVGLTAATASAQTTTATATPKGCKHAEVRIDHLQKAVTAMEARIDRLHKAIAKARAAGHDRVVARLERRLDKAQRRHDRAVDRIAKIRQRCSKQ